jgi:hypothetical protein
MKWAAILVIAAACDTPTPSLFLHLAGPPSQACPSTQCAEVPMSCPTVMNIRIVDPADPANPEHWYIDQCEDVSANTDHDMCALATVDLDSKPIPVRPLEVQVAVYPASAIPRDPITGKRSCPPGVVYSANGYPIEQSPTPALGGHAFYHPGDERVVVTLGCTDFGAIEQSCAMEQRISVSSTVDDLTSQTPVPRTSSLAVQLRVSVGEPRAEGVEHMLNPGDVRTLDLSTASPHATWRADVDLDFDKYACIEVFEENAATPATLRCKPIVPGQNVDMQGVWIARDKVREILDWLAPQAPFPAALPAQGLTIGMVVDPNMHPAAGYTVMAAGSTVIYPTSEGRLIGSQTSDSGLFMSTDALFGTQFSARGSGLQTNTAIGGRVSGKFTVVILTAGQ